MKYTFCVIVLVWNDKNKNGCVIEDDASARTLHSDQIRERRDP